MYHSLLTPPRPPMTWPTRITTNHTDGPIISQVHQHEQRHAQPHSIVTALYSTTTTTPHEPHSSTITTGSTQHIAPTHRYHPQFKRLPLYGQSPHSPTCDIRATPSTSQERTIHAPRTRTPLDHPHREQYSILCNVMNKINQIVRSLVGEVKGQIGVEVRFCR
jgi:hypothetical protein